jgi:hypothetical protein
MDRDYDELHLVVTHPVIGQFVAQKITDPKKLKDDTFIDRTVNMLERTLKRKHSWPDCDPVIFTRRIKNGLEVK